MLSCSYSEPRIRPEPIASGRTTDFNSTTDYIPQRISSSPSTLGSPSGNPTSGSAPTVGLTGDVAGVQLRCVEWQSGFVSPFRAIGEFFTGMHSTAEDCVYVAVNPKSIPIIQVPFEPSCEQKQGNETVAQGGAAPAAPAPAPDATVQQSCASTDRVAKANQIRAVTESLLYYSLYNCNNFLSRAFAVKTDVGFSQGLISTILSGTTTIITPVASIPSLVPTAINGGNTVLSGGVTDFNSAFYSSKSFDVMEAGIVAERQILRRQIEARLCMTEVNSTTVCSIPKSDNYPGYTPSAYNSSLEALIDVGVYDRVCSFEGGLKELAQEAAKKQQTADEANGVGTPAPSPSAAPSPTDTSSPAASSSSAPTPAHHASLHEKTSKAANARATPVPAAPASAAAPSPTSLRETPAKHEIATRDDREVHLENVGRANAGISTVSPATADYSSGPGWNGGERTTRSQEESRGGSEWAEHTSLGSEWTDD